MQLAYRMTTHARLRMTERSIRPDEVFAALHKRGHWSVGGIVEYFDPRSRVAVKVNPLTRTIITIYRRQPTGQRRRRKTHDAGN